MDADNNKVIIKRKTWNEATHRDDVHIAESLINHGLSRNVRYMMQVFPNDSGCLIGVYFRLLCTKGAYPNGIIEGNKVLNV